MAKKFYYDSMGFYDLNASGRIKAGTYSSGNFTASDGAITNEHYIADMSIARSVTGFGDEDTIRIDFTSSKTASSILLYNTGSQETNDLYVYKSSSATSSLTEVDQLATTDAGWDADEFSSTSERYWFLRSEDGDFTGLSEVILGVPLTFENEPDIGSSTTELFATDINKSYGGVEYGNKKHNPQSTWTLNFKNISQTFKDNLVSFEQSVTDFKKFVYYDESSYHYVRLDGPINFIEVAYQRYSASIKLREQLS